MIKHLIPLALSAAFLASCGSADTTEDQPAATGAEAEGAPSAQASSSAKTSNVSCGSLPTPQGDSILGATPGMSPDQIANILTCRGYEQIWPNAQTLEHVRLAEEERGIFRLRFQKPDEEDYVAVFSEGVPGQQKAYYVGRGTSFSENAPTMDAVIDQFKTTYQMPGDVERDGIGVVTMVKVTPSAAPVGSVSGGDIGRHCTGLASSFDPDKGYSEVMNKAPLPSRNCGPSLSFIAIPNGTNEGLAYLARYRLANLQLGYELQEARLAHEKSAEGAAAAQEVQQARENGQLPDL